MWKLCIDSEWCIKWKQTITYYPITGIKRRGGHVCVGTYVNIYMHVFASIWIKWLERGWSEPGMGKRKNRKSSVLFGTSVLSKHVSHGNTPRPKESYLHMVHPSSCHQWGWRTGSVLSRRHFCLCCLKTDGPGPNPNVNQKKQKDNVCFSLVSSTDVTF